METKTCPYCYEEIHAQAIKCKHCGSMLNEELHETSAGLASKRITRSSTEKILGGVCGGFGNYLGVDPTLLRVIWIIVVCFTAILPGVLTYLLLWLIIPKDTDVARY